MSIEYVKNKCCGCRNCLQVCKLNAISFTTDEYGFEIPTINKEICVNCMVCEKACPVVNAKKNLSDSIYGGIAYALDSQIKYQGSSGGLFGVFANEIISQRGVVFGAAFDSNLKLRTKKAETKKQLVPLYKSKYLLCDTDFKFFEIEKMLKKNKYVLYCSTPCQIQALKLFLKVEYKNLFTIDFACHGVGSQTLFDKFIKYLETKKGIKIDDFSFRSKNLKLSSHEYKMSYFKNGTLHSKNDLYFSFPYYNAYCKQLVCRDSCYKCQFASRNRTSDITLGDFHTVNKYRPEIDRFAGVSMILINTKKGKELFDSVSSKIYYEKIELETIYANNRFDTNGVISKEVIQFRESMHSQSLGETVKKHLSPKKDCWKQIYYKMPGFLKKIVQKMFGG